MKVAELKGAELDYWVAKAEGRKPLIQWAGKSYEMCQLLDGQGDRDGPEVFKSSDWKIGGPIIERENIAIEKHRDGWVALHNDIFEDAGGLPSSPHCYGETPLIAAMRSFVTSKYGEEVTEEPKP